MEWRSADGVLVRFSEFNTVNSIRNGVLLVALTPGTSYQIKVSAITEDGQGAEVRTTGRTRVVDSSLGEYLDHQCTWMT